MRATISFETDVDKVEPTMATLVSQEAGTLLIAANILENLGHGPLLQEVNETIDLLRGTTSQLLQYQQMLIGFEKARFDTILPQNAEKPVAVNNMQEVRKVAQQMQSFDSFLGRINGETTDEEPAPEEG